MADPRAPQLARIRRAARLVELRLRLDRVLRLAPYVLVCALGVAGATLAVRKVFPDVLSESGARRILVALGAASLAALAVAALRRLPPRAGSLALDKVHDLSGRLTNGLAFFDKPESERSPLMEVAIDDACAHADSLSPRRAAPLQAPRDLIAPLCVAAGVAAIAMLEIRTIVPPAPKAATIDALTMAPDDLDLFRDAAKELAQRQQTPEVQAAIDKFNQLIEDIANKRLDRTEAFRRMEAIERELLKGAEADAKTLTDSLEETARELKRSDLAKPIAESLEKKDLEKAKKEFENLADKLRDKKKRPSKAELDKLRQALERAAQRRKETLAALEEKRAEARDDLLKKKQKAQNPDGGAPDPKEESLLKKKERELERLEREVERQQQAQRKLDKLDRDLAKAAEDLMKDLGVTAEDLDQAAEDINRLQEEEMSDKEKEELRKRLEEMREVLRQQGQGGQQRMQRMKRFSKRARGDGGESGLEGEGQQQGGAQNGRPNGEEGEGEGEDGQGSRGEKGKGQKGEGGQQWVLGPGGKKILVPGKGRGGQEGQGEGQGQGQGQGQKDGQGNGGGEGKGIGSDHQGNVAGKRTDPKMDTIDVQTQGLDTQQGASNSEVILSAAERGFRGGSYKKVFRDYHTVAEQQINKDQIPDGYRFYVHRYFQLIRPRE